MIFVIEVYNKITKHAEETTNPPSSSRMKLFCGDKFAAYIPDGQQTPDGRIPRELIPSPPWKPEQEID